LGFKTSYLANQALLIFRTENICHASSSHQNMGAVGLGAYYYANPKHGTKATWQRVFLLILVSVLLPYFS